MKKIFFVLLFISCNLSQASYVKMKEDFKKDLYQRQKTLMSEDQYMKLLDQYLAQAEEQLSIPSGYLQQESPNSKLCNDYFYELANYNVAIFFSYIVPNDENIKINRSIFKGRLLSVMKEIKKSALSDLNIDEEIDKTESIFIAANEDYYNQLSYAKKIAIWLRKFF